MPFEIVRNDITRMKVDAIVNAANSSLLGGGGVDGAIHRAAGPKLLEECRTLGGCRTGSAKITRGYDLPAKYVIHTVGPIWAGGTHGERELLSSCYASSLALAKEYACESIAFPMISTGAYGYPKDEAMEVAVEAISRFLLQNDMQVYLVVFGRESFSTGKKLFNDVQSYIDDVYVEEHLDENVEASRKRYWRRKEAQAFEEALCDTMAPTAAPTFGAMPDVDWNELLRKTDEGFSQALLRMIDERGMKDSECYRKANIDRKLFSKIRSNPEYRPSKQTVFAFAMALELSLDEAANFLNKAGFSISHSSRFDVVMEYFLKNRFYDVPRINEVLFDCDLPLLGSGNNVA